MVFAIASRRRPSNAASGALSTGALLASALLATAVLAHTAPTSALPTGAPISASSNGGEADALDRASGSVHVPDSGAPAARRSDSRARAATTSLEVHGTRLLIHSPPTTDVPLLLFYPGTGRRAADYRWLFAPTHATVVIDEEPLCATFDRLDGVGLADALRAAARNSRAHPLHRNRLSNRTVLAGHSIGALTAHNNAVGVPADGRFALLTFAAPGGVTAHYFGRSVYVPFVAVVGTHDCLTPVPFSRDVLAQSESRAPRLVVVPGANHINWADVDDQAQRVAATAAWCAPMAARLQLLVGRCVVASVVSDSPEPLEQAECAGLLALNASGCDCCAGPGPYARLCATPPTIDDDAAARSPRRWRR